MKHFGRGRILWGIWMRRLTASTYALECTHHFAAHRVTYERDFTDAQLLVNKVNNVASHFLRVGRSEGERGAREERVCSQICVRTNQRPIARAMGYKQMHAHMHKLNPAKQDLVRHGISML